jgi:DNA-binding XRE family transcriptional regulator
MSPILTTVEGDTVLIPVRVPRKLRARPGSLKAWRVARGINQRTAAQALGMSQAHYSRLERETHFAKPTLAKRLSVLTGLDLEVLLGRHR